MAALILSVALQIASLLLIAAAMWGVGRLRKSDPRRGFPRYLGIAAGAAILTLLVTWLMSYVTVTTVFNAYVAMAVSVTAQFAAVAMLISMVLGIKGKRVIAYLGAYVVASMAVGAAMFLLVRPYLMEAFYVPANSMAPTIRDGDRVVASKWRMPQRWDVVVFEVPHEMGTRFVKRIVALPGETLMIKDGQVHINGQPQMPPVAVRYLASLPNAHGGLLREGESFVVPAGRYFVLGDNSANAYDSRFLGPIDTVAVVGVAEFIYWPNDHWRLLR